MIMTEDNKIGTYVRRIQKIQYKNETHENTYKKNCEM